jgi:hypothetical protein
MRILDFFPHNVRSLDPFFPKENNFFVPFAPYPFLLARLPRYAKKKHPTRRQGKWNEQKQKA